MTLVVRSDERPEPLIGAVRAVVREVNPALAVFDVKPVEAVIAESLSAFTLFLWLMSAFAALAMVLAATGVHGVMAYLATSRTRELAIRAAIGADRTRIAGLVLGQGTRLIVAGMAAGVLLTLALRPLLAIFPLSVRPPDAALLTIVGVVITLVALAGCVLPAVRASRLDVSGTLHSE